jgi:hypothetical protein
MKRRNFILASSTIASGLFSSQSKAAIPCPPPLVSLDGSTTTTSCTASSNEVTSSASLLGVRASSMSPGTWAVLTPANDQNAILGVGSISGSMIHYCNSMPWNADAKCIEILGEDHNWGSVRYARYNAASNSFSLVTNDVGLGAAVMHGYDHWTINPFTNDIYHRQYSLDTGSIHTFVLKAGSSGPPTALPTVPSAQGAEQVAIGSCWWSGSFSGAGAQGSHMVYNSGNALNLATDGQVVAYNPLTNTWFYNRDGMAPFSRATASTYHSVMEYSSVKNVAVYGGGGGAPNKLWRLNADGSRTAMPDVPSGKAVGIQLGNLVCDPVTGNFLLLSAGELWELNPTGSGTWTKQTGSRIPPSGVGIPGPGTLKDGVISCSIPDYGVVAYIKQTNSAGGTFYLYKHAE